MDGIDEENCDKLEFNECENYEYRCVNGMCIPGEYWLDGELDKYRSFFRKKELCTLFYVRTGF